MIYYAESVRHLRLKIGLPLEKLSLERFSDGELHIQLLHPPKRELAWVVASTPPPAENLLELIFLLGILKHEKIPFNLLLTYFGYARQDRAKAGESFAGKTVCDLLRPFKPSRLFICHMHSPRLRRYLKYDNLVPHELFEDLFRQADAVAVPDKGGVPVGQRLSRVYGIPLIRLTKERWSKDKVRAKALKGEVEGKRVILFDDLVSTGRTLVEAARLLKKNGAQSIVAAATHGVFSGTAIPLLENSPIARVFVTNTLPQRKRSSKIRVRNISPYLEKIVRDLQRLRPDDRGNGAEAKLETPIKRDLKTAFELEQEEAHYQTLREGD